MAVNLPYQRSQWSQRSERTARLHRLVALFAVLALFVTACGADFANEAADTASETTEGATAEDFDEMAMEEAEAMVEDAMEEEAPADEVTTAAADDAAQNANGPATNSGQTPPTRTAAQRGREIIYTATVSIGVDDVEAAGAEAAAIIEEIGGFVSDQNTSGGAEPRSQITFKVDPENFTLVLQRLGGIGELRNQVVSTDDVTERVVDLSSRIEVTQLGVDPRGHARHATHLA